MFNSGYRNRKAGDGTGVINVQSQYIQKIAPNPVITSWSIQGSDDTALNPAGGQTVLVNGSGFVTGVSATLNGVQIGAVTLISSTQISFTAPANAGGSYTLIVYNTSGEAAILVPGLTYSSVPTWTTAAGSIGTYYETTPISSNVVATSDSALTYSLASGSLPTGATLYANGVITGTAPVDSGSTTYTFAITATDAELQDVTRTFTMTINVDVVTWVTPSNGATISLAGGVASNVLSATDAAGYSVSYTANALPTGLSLTGNTISGTASASGNTSTLLTATAATTGRSATNTITWVVVLGDSYFQYDTLLLSADASITTPSFIKDSSTNNYQVTVVGDTRAQNFNPYQPGYYSNYFDGTSDFLDIAGNTAFDLSTADFTIEGWFYPRAANGMIVNYGVVPGSSQGSYNYQVYAGGASLVVRYSTGGFTSVNSSNAYNLNAWNYFCISRTTTSISIYLNGTTTTGSIAATINNNASSTLRIGMDIDTNYSMSGYISNLRILKGTATPSPSTPTAPLTAVANTSLLTCQSNRFIDNSSNNFTITKNGDTAVKSANPFVLNSSYATYGSGYFDGTGDCLTANSAAGNFTGDFTVEGWYYWTSFASYQTLFALYTNNYYVQSTLSGGSTFAASADFGLGTVLSNATLNTWYHIVICRTGSTLSSFVNGTRTATVTKSGTFGTTGDTLIIGAQNTTQWSVYGYISNFRIVKGTDVYGASNSTITVPTAPLTAVANTSLLTLQYNGAYNNNQFQDNSNFNNLVTRNGNPTSGTFSPYGNNWSNYFDGNGDYLTIPSSTLWTFGGDCTIEFWAYITSAGSYVLIHGDSTSSSAILASDTRMLWQNSWSMNDTINVSGLSSCVNQWTHFAFSRAGSTGRLYRNGVQVATGTFSATYSSSYVVTIGYDNLNAVPSAYTQGFISNLRVVNGTAVYTSAFTPSTAPLTAIANTSLLTCQSNRLIDNSPNNFAITKNGDVSVQKFSPFATVTVPAYYSGYFDGTGDYLNIANNAALQVGSSDFTFEAWIYPLSLPGAGNYKTFWSKRTALTGAGGYGGACLVMDSTGALQFFVASNSTTWGISGSSSGLSISLNTWQHLAMVRSGNNLILYKNGVAGSTVTLNFSVYDTGAFTLMAGTSVGDQAVDGYMSNFRLVKGTAVYTTAFTPPSAPLTAIANTSLLTCQSNTFIDNSTNNFAITVNGNANPLSLSPFTPTASAATSYSAATFSGSMYFDGTGDYLGITSLPAFGTGDFTIDGWVYNTGGTTNRGVFELAGSVLSTSVGISLAFYSNGGGWQYSYAASSTTTVATTLLVNTWYHFAFSRSSGTLKIYINGAQIASVSDTTNYTFNALTVGGYYSTSQLLIGYISDMRVIPGTALYTSAFYPGSSPSVAVGTKPGTTSIYNSSVLLNGTSGAVVDASRTVDLETVADARTTTSVSPYAGGGVSYYFDGTGDYLTIPNSQANNFGTGNFTIEFWVYAASLSNSPAVIAKAAAQGDSVGWFVEIAANTVYFGYGTNSGQFATFTVTLPTNTWKFIAVTRVGGTFNCFVNGVSPGAISGFSANAFDNTNPMTIGRGFGSATFDLVGYIADLRITKGYARYTSTFTPPTTPLPTY